MANAKYRYWVEGEGLETISAWARDGLTDEDIAKRVGIGVRTIYDWKKRYPQFLQALNNNKAIADARVENALYKRALGFDTVERITVEDAEGNKTVKTVEKHIPGDVTAQIYWMKNRMPEKWRDKIQVEHSGQIDLAGTLQTARENAAAAALEAEKEVGGKT